MTDDRDEQLRMARARERQAKARFRRSVAAVAFGIAGAAVCGVALSAYVGLVIRIGRAVAG